MKKLLGILVLGLLWSSVSFAENHHHFFICDEVGGTNSIIELEIDFKKNKVWRDGYVYKIGEKPNK